MKLSPMYLCHLAGLWTAVADATSSLLLLLLLLLNSMALVREGTIPTERQPLVGEVSVNFCG
jgi:hypothetical protein